MAGSAKIPDNLGEGGAHLTGFGRGGGLKAYLESILLDLRGLRDAYNTHTHGAAVSAPEDSSPAETVSVGTIFESEA